MAATDVLDAFQPKLLIAEITSIRQAVAAKQDRVTRLELKREFVVRHAGEQAGRNAGDLKDATFASTKQKGAGHADRIISPVEG